MAYDELMGMAPLARRGLVDGMIAQNRAVTPASAQEQRKAPRYSIEELNSMDLPEIKARWSADPLDTRGAGTRVLDMIDLPRNVIANTLFKATGVVKDDPRNKAALGLQRISVSDALEAMGVENRIVRGVGGFVGDVLLDPVTYLGAPGFGIKAVSSGGRTIKVGLGGRRAINAASLEARAGKAVSDPAIAKVLALDNVGTDAAKISESLYATGKPAWKRLGELFGMDRSTEGFLGYADPLVSRTGVEAEKQAAAMEFVRRYGQGTAPGVRIGKDAAGKWGVEIAGQGPGRIKAGSALAHIPFTEISLSVPALTGDAMYGLAAQTLREVNEKSDPAMAATMGKIRDLDELSRTQMDLLNGLRTADPEQRAYTLSDLAKARERMQPVLQELDMELGAQQKAAEALNDPAKLLAIGRLRDASQALATKITADAAKWQIENGEAMARYRDQIKPLLETRTEELTRANLTLENQKVADARKKGAQPFRDEAAKVKGLAELAAEDARVAREEYKRAWDATDDAMHETSNLYSAPKKTESTIIDPETGEPMVDAVNAPDNMDEVAFGDAAADAPKQPWEMKQESAKTDGATTVYGFAGEREAFKIRTGDGAQIIGRVANVDFPGAQSIPDRGEIFSIDVPESARRSGKGTKLVEDSIRLIAANGGKTVKLTVPNKKYGQPFVDALIDRGTLGEVVSRDSRTGTLEVRIPEHVLADYPDLKPKAAPESGRVGPPPAEVANPPSKPKGEAAVDPNRLNLFERTMLGQEKSALSRKLSRDVTDVLDGKATKTAGGWTKDELLEPGVPNSANARRYVEVSGALDADAKATPKGATGKESLQAETTRPEKSPAPPAETPVVSQSNPKAEQQPWEMRPSQFRDWSYTQDFKAKRSAAESAEKLASDAVIKLEQEIGASSKGVSSVVTSLDGVSVKSFGIMQMAMAAREQAEFDAALSKMPKEFQERHAKAVYEYELAHARTRTFEGIDTAKEMLAEYPDLAAPAELETTKVPEAHKTTPVAAAEGKPVPPEVLADYPDLKPNSPTEIPDPRTLEERLTAKSNIDDEFGINEPLQPGGIDITPDGQDPRLTARSVDPTIRTVVQRDSKKFNPNAVKLSKKHIESKLEQYGFTSGMDEMDEIVREVTRDNTQRTLTNISAADFRGRGVDLSDVTDMLGSGLTFKTMPGELKDAIRSKPYLRKYINIDNNIAKQNLSPGWEALQNFGADRLIRYLELSNMGHRKRAIETAKYAAAQEFDNNLAYLSRIHDDVAGTRIDPKKFVAIENPDGLRPGTKFQYLGNGFTVAEDGKNIVAKSDDTGKAADIRLDGVEHLFVDKGTLKHTIRGKGKMSDAARALNIGDTGYIAADKIYLNDAKFGGTSGPTWDAAEEASGNYQSAVRQYRELQGRARKLESLANQVEKGVPARRKVGYNEIEARTGVPEDSFRAMNKRLQVEQTFGIDPNVYAMPRAKDEIVGASAKEAADIMRKGMDDAAKWMVDITPEELDARAFLADAIHGTADAAKQLADATGAPLLATMRGEDVNLRRAAELALGYTPDMLGNGSFMSMARAMDSIMGPDSEAANFLAKMDAGMGRALGSRESTLKDLTREYARWDAARGQAVEAEAGKRIVELAGVAEKFGVPPEKLDELGAAYLLAAFTKADPNLANFSPRDPIHGLLASAKAGGLLDAKTNPELVATIQGMAARDIGLLADYANQEQRMGVLGKLMDNYMPNVLTADAGVAARAQRRNFPVALGKGAEASNAPGDALSEFFSKPRSTYVYDIDGKDYLAGSLEVMKGMSVDDIRKLSLDPVAEDALMDLKAVQETFDALPDDVKPKPRPASQFYINQLVEQGQMAMLTGGRELTKGFFETSPPLIMAARIGAHERARIRTYFDEMMKNLAVPYNEKIVGTTANAAGATFKTQGGAEGQVSKAADGSLRVTIGNQRFRTVSPEVIASGSDLLDAKNPKFANALLPERAADAVENFYRVTAKEPQAWLAAIDSATKYWKSATLLHPSWTIGDLAGGFVLAAGMGITPAEMTKHGASAFKMIARTDPDKLAALKIPVAGMEMSGAKIAQEIADGGVLHGARNAEAVAHILHDGVALTPAQYSLLRNPKEALHEVASRGQMRARAMAYGSLTGQPNALQKAKGLVVDEVYLDRLWKPWVRMNGKVNDWMRSTAYLALRDRGYDPTSAARTVSEGMLDMGSLSDVESNVLRRLIPFYAWMKASAVHGLRQAYLNPKYFSIYPHAARAFEEATAGDARVPEYARPRWMRDQMAIQVGADPSTRMAFMSGTLLPQEAATRWMAGMASPAIGMAGLQDLAGYVASGVSPLLRVPMEVGFGQEFYTGRTIRSQEGQGDFTPGEYLMSQIRPLREFGVGQVRQGAIQNAASRGPGQLAGRVLIGGRFQPFDDERLKFNNLKEFKDAEGQIRKRINVAERDGNNDASQQSRVALLKLYESMQARGLGDEVPKWARKQLPAVTSGQSE